MEVLQQVLAAYGLDSNHLQTKVIGSGLIHRTWKVTVHSEHYILQEVNDNVFKDPQAISDNIKTIGSYLQMHHPHYLFVEPITAFNGNTLVTIKGEGLFRLFPFVKESHTFEVAATPQHAYEAAMQFGRFTKLLSELNVKKMKITLPSFHDLTLRFVQFKDALQNGNQQRIQSCQQLIQQLLGYGFIEKEYKSILKNPQFKKRVTHHDTKISNVLFDANDKGLCVIDLDTVMPGYFISDVGDMIRTYLSPVNEEETDFSKIEVRDEFYKAIVEGYMAEMQNELSESEKKHFFYAGQFMMYMQAIRFLTDYFNDDVYYGSKYAGHNLSRAMNQTVLLERFMEKKNIFESFTSHLLN
jgi:Ser/Thr protein kinase RdoA (MazF antagonist)